MKRDLNDGYVGMALTLLTLILVSEVGRMLDGRLLSEGALAVKVVVLCLALLLTLYGIRRVRRGAAKS